MVKAVSHRGLYTMVHIRSLARLCKICAGQRVAEIGISRSTSVSPVRIIPPMIHNRSFFNKTHQKGKQMKPENLETQ